MLHKILSFAGFLIHAEVSKIPPNCCKYKIFKNNVSEDKQQQSNHPYTKTLQYLAMGFDRIKVQINIALVSISMASCKGINSK